MDKQTSNVSYSSIALLYQHLFQLIHADDCQLTYVRYVFSLLLLLELIITLEPVDDIDLTDDTANEMMANITHWCWQLPTYDPHSRQCHD